MCLKTISIKKILSYSSSFSLFLLARYTFYIFPSSFSHPFSLFFPNPHRQQLGVGSHGLWRVILVKRVVENGWALCGSWGVVSRNRQQNGEREGEILGSMLFDWFVNFIWIFSSRVCLLFCSFSRTRDVANIDLRCEV